jgi:hypothetical protein
MQTTIQRDFPVLHLKLSERLEGVLNYNRNIVAEFRDRVAEGRISLRSIIDSAGREVIAAEYLLDWVGQVQVALDNWDCTLAQDREEIVRDIARVTDRLVTDSPVRCDVDEMASRQARQSDLRLLRDDVLKAIDKQSAAVAVA